MVTLDYFSDLLCVWAYVAQPRLDELERQFGGQVQVRHHYINLFGDTESRIGQGWKDRGGFEGFAVHTQEVTDNFPELKLSPKVWRSVRPRSSIKPHLYVKAVELASGDAALGPKLALALRQAFFVQGENIAEEAVIHAHVKSLGLTVEAVRHALSDGNAHAMLWQDQLLREKYQLRGSPTYVLDNGRQSLFGNVGYRILEANIKELLEKPAGGASWC